MNLGIHAVNLRMLRPFVSAVEQSTSTERAGQELNGPLAAIAQAFGIMTNGLKEGKITRLDAIEFLVGVLQASAVLYSTMASPLEQNNVSSITREETHAELAGTLGADLSKQVRDLVKTLGLDDVAYASSAAVCASAIEQAVVHATERLPKNFFEAIVREDGLSEAQTEVLREVDAALQQEYTLRRKMLIERAVLTVESFGWSSKLTRAHGNKYLEVEAQQSLLSLDHRPPVSLRDVYHATLGDLTAVLERATGNWAPNAGYARIKGVLIGSVPDRGGRPDGTRKGATMPAWSGRRRKKADAAVNVHIK